MQPKSRIPNQFPRDQNLGSEALQVLDSMLVQINNLISQGQAPQSSGLQSLQNNLIDPTGAQIISGGSRTASITTEITFTSTTTSISFFWDGSNGSKPFTIYRDDGSTVGPIVFGSGLTVTGLTANTTYFFYFYWDELLDKITAVSIPNVSVGTPPIAFAAGNAKALQQQFFREHIPLANGFSSSGITTPASGTASGTGGAGGGAGAAGGGLKKAL